MTQLAVPRSRHRRRRRDNRRFSGRFAEIVFDRPLDHAYTYAVPDELAPSIGVGKRVLAPFGQGDRPTVGFCVGLDRGQAGTRGQGDAAGAR